MRRHDHNLERCWTEAAPEMQGLLDDFWHRPLTDVGLAGPDQGKGGKYLLLPPGYSGFTADRQRFLFLLGTDQPLPSINIVLNWRRALQEH